MDEPLVTVNILSFNRKDELRNSLQKIFGQDYKKIEVIVVDNASDDGSAEMVRREFPDARVIELPTNMGVSAWNTGFNSANGDFILVLDDDSFPVDGTISAAVNAILKEKNCGAIACRIVNKNRGEEETLNFLVNPDYFIGCGAVIRSEALSETGGYSPHIFIYNNELDFCIRLYNAGYKVVYCEDSVVIHNQNKHTRRDPLTTEFSYYNNFISYYTYLILNFTSSKLLFSLSRLFINRLIILLKYPYMGSFIRAVIFSAKNYRRLRRGRNHISGDIQRRFNYGNMSLVDRVFFKGYGRK